MKRIIQVRQVPLHPSPDLGAELASLAIRPGDYFVSGKDGRGRDTLSLIRHYSSRSERLAEMLEDFGGVPISEAFPE